jgi:hypothetical protein
MTGTSISYLVEDQMSGVFYLKVPVPEETAALCRIQYFQFGQKAWPVLGTLHEWFYTQPVANLIGACQSRCEAFDISEPGAEWACVAIDPFDEIDDETKMLLLLKYDMSSVRHRPK